VTDDEIICKALTILSKRIRQVELLDSSQTVRDYCKLNIATREHEVFGCLFLNNTHHLIAFEELFFGTIDGAAVYPREVVKRALFHNASALIFCHNHPSGVTEPSRADMAITEKLIKACSTVSIRVLDHIVVTCGECTSMAERGLMEVSYA